jgi:hypothetical protein
MLYFKARRNTSYFSRQDKNDHHKLRRLRRATGPRRAAMREVQNQILQFDLPTRPLAPRAQADL